MKMQKPVRITSVLVSLLAIFSLVPAQFASAAGSSLSVSPSSQSMQPGASFTVQVQGTLATGSGFGADTVAGTLQFPSNLLKVTSISTSGATFNWQISATPGNGTVAFDERGFFATDNTNVFVMAVTFQALANGTASVGFSSDSGYYNNNFGITYPTSRSGGTYTISTPTPPPSPPPPTPTPTPSPTPTPAPTPTPSPTPHPSPTPTPSPAPKTPNPAPTSPSTTPETPGQPSTPAASPDISGQSHDSTFSISEVTATRSYSTTVIDWKTSAASKATVAFGTSLKDLSQTVDATQLPDGSYEAKLTDLTPGKQYYYAITATSQTDQTKTDTYSGLFIVRGFPVVLTITENGGLASNAKVKIGEQNYSTDKNGKISLELASGSYNIEIKTQNGSKSFTLAVAKKTVPDNGNSPDTQKFTFDVPATVAAADTSSNNLPLIIGGFVAAALLVAGVLFWLLRRRKGQDEQSTTVINADNDYSAWAQQQPQAAYPQQAMAPPQMDQQYSNIPVTQQPAMPQDAAMSLDPTMAQSDQGASLPNDGIPQADQTMTPQAPAPEPQYQEVVPAQQSIEEYQQQAMSQQTPEAETAAATTAPSTAPTEPAAEVIQTPSGSELQINHAAQPQPQSPDGQPPQATA